MTPETLTLSNGLLRFTASAMGTGPLVILIHGFPDTRDTFNAQLPALAEAGFRAVAVSLRGYEPSSQPDDGDYRVTALAADVIAWIDALGETTAHLVGHDWGATIAFAATALAPDRIASLAVLAVPHPARFAETYLTVPAQQARSAYILEFMSPDADAMIVADNCAYLETLWRKWSPGWSFAEGDIDPMRRAMQQPGVATAALSYYRLAFDAVSDAGKAAQALLAGPFAVPTLGLTGEEDGCISADVFEASMRDADFPGSVRVEPISGAGHFLHREATDQVNSQLICWMRRH
ncbi:MAG: alpha/beta hydrolase [Sphingomonas sp.]|uniref:alpha/beta fold hydrolase n=1 Tax=Sphingomonas sp. TaxID=28214 RepID=UPI0025F3BF4C|nr:alpha/beta hydrolase [Sphingomonas sp.]MBY0285057.1 alpha/beta hydrolase [Sphingomonas sp.]